jgi:pimeloyl-ACP methyl ester carboxylesterase
MASVELGGLRVGYELVGDGPSLVLLHGYVGDGVTTWRPQIEGLSGEFAMVVWDAPGAGRSWDPPEQFGMADYADCLAALIVELDLVRPCVAGLSFGGALALELCRRHPELVGRLILASGYAGWAGSLSGDVAAQRLQQALALADLSADEFEATLLPTMFSEGTPQATIDEFAASVRAFHPAGFRAMARACAEDLRDTLPCVAVPTLLVSGDHDVRAPLAVAEQLHAGIADSRLVVLADAGHLCNLEKVDEFNDTVRRFLSDDA